MPADISVLSDTPSPSISSENKTYYQNTKSITIPANYQGITFIVYANKLSHQELMENLEFPVSNESATEKLIQMGIIDTIYTYDDEISTVTLSSSDGKSYTVTPVIQGTQGEQTTYILPAGTYEFVVQADPTALAAPKTVTVTLTVTTKNGKTSSATAFTIHYYARQPSISLAPYGTSYTAPSITNKSAYVFSATINSVFDDEQMEITSSAGNSTLTIERKASSTAGKYYYLISQTVNLPADTIYTYTLTAIDVYGNSRTVSVYVRLYTTLPVLTITSPTNGLSTNNSNTASHVVGTVKPGNVNYASIQSLSVNSVSAVFGSPDSNGLCSFDLYAEGLTEGENVITIIAIDSVGNTTTSTRTVRLDTKPPVISTIVTDSTIIDVGTMLHIAISVSDPA